MSSFKPKKKGVVVDIDGTIFDISERWNQCQRFTKRSEMWNCVFDPEKIRKLDKPKHNVINYIKDLSNKGYDIIFVSGRVETLRDVTLEQFEKYNIPHTRLYLRPKGNFTKDVEYKSEIIDQLLKEGYDIELVIDDSKDIREVIRQKFNIKTVDPDELSLGTEIG